MELPLWIASPQRRAHLQERLDESGGRPLLRVLGSHLIDGLVRPEPGETRPFVACGLLGAVFVGALGVAQGDPASLAMALAVGSLAGTLAGYDPWSSSARRTFRLGLTALLHAVFSGAAALTYLASSERWAGRRGQIAGLIVQLIGAGALAAVCALGTSMRTRRRYRALVRRRPLDDRGRLPAVRYRQCG